MKIIGVAGKAGCGKSTVGDLLVKEFGWVAVAFADPLKQWAKSVFDFSDVQLWGSSTHRNEPDKRYPRTDAQGVVTFCTPREVLQRLGTEVGRACYPPIWAERGLKVAHALLAEPHLHDGKPYLWRYEQSVGLYRVAALRDLRPVNGVVFTDARFETEVSVIRAAGGKIVQVDREVEALPGELSAHVSEAGLTPEQIDMVLYNRGTLEEFKSSIRTFAQSLRK